jgi:hypothetical protein
VNRLDDRALSYAHASADGFTVGHLSDINARIFGGRRKQELPAERNKILLGTQPIHVAMAVGGVTHKDHTREFAIL